MPLTFILLAGCGSERMFIDVEGNGWPDGAVVTAFSGESVSGRTTLFGGRARLALNHQGGCRLLCGGPNSLATFTGTFEVGQGVNHVTLPIHMPRRRIDGRAFGCVFNGAGQDSIVHHILETTGRQLTTITLDAPEGVARESFSELIAASHNYQVEVIARNPDSPISEGHRQQKDRR